MLLNIATFGIRLYKTRRGNYKLETEDAARPVTHTAYYETRGEAIADIVRNIVNPENVYSMEDIPEDLRKAFEMVGVPSKVRPHRLHPTLTFLYYVLDGIACANECRRG